MGDRQMEVEEMSDGYSTDVRTVCVFEKGIYIYDESISVMSREAVMAFFEELAEQKCLQIGNLGWVGESCFVLMHNIRFVHLS